jgi:hypothetical protein
VEAGCTGWRRLTATLLVGLAPEGVFGCIEVGRRFTATDGEGRVYGRYRRLEDAQAMLTLLRETRAAGALSDRQRALAQQQAAAGWWGPVQDGGATVSVR